MLDFSNWDFSNKMYIIAQLVGIIPLVLSYFTFILKKRKSILMAKLCSDLLWSVHFFLLLQFTGGIINAVNTVRDAVLYHREKRWASHWLVLFFFALLSVGASLIKWQGWYSAIPLIGSLIALVGFWCKDPQTIKRLNFPAVLLWLIYGLIVGSISTIICNILSLISLTISEINFQKKSKSQRASL